MPLHFKLSLFEVFFGTWGALNWIFGYCLGSLQNLEKILVDALVEDYSNYLNTGLVWYSNGLILEW